MFLRKLVVMAAPLAMAGMLLALAGPLGNLGFWGEAVLGFLGGLALSALPMAGGAGRGRTPFRRLLIVPLAALTVLVVLQSFAVRGMGGWLPETLTAPSTLQLVLEAAFAGGLLGSVLLG